MRLENKSLSEQELEEEDSALERPLNEGQKPASWLENGMENVR